MPPLPPPFFGMDGFGGFFGVRDVIGLGAAGFGVAELGFRTEAALSSEVQDAEMSTLVGPELEAWPA